jgi:hypothetical protein
VADLSPLRALATLAAASLLKRHELGIPPDRCLVCATRPSTVVSFPDDPCAIDAGQPCVRCGRRPVVISVVYTNEWHPRGSGP